MSSLDQQRREDMERVIRHVDQLCEHFDTVHIFATRHMPAEHDGTIIINQGSGNWSARYGQVREWIIMEEERMRVPGRPSRE